MVFHGSACSMVEASLGESGSMRIRDIVSSLSPVAEDACACARRDDGGWDSYEEPHAGVR